MTDSLGAREFVAGLVQGSAGAVCGDRKPEINAGKRQERKHTAIFLKETPQVVFKTT